jgi:hypothetical protein
MYSIGTSQINNADPVIIKTEKVNIKDRLLLIPKDWIFFWSPTKRYATTMLIIKGVRIEPKMDIIIKKANKAIEKTIVSSLLNIFLKNKFNCSIIVNAVII